MAFEIRSNSERLEYSTVRIFCNDGLSVGTGFFFTFSYPNNINVPVIVTNKHVIDGMSYADLVFHSLIKESEEHIKNEIVRYENFQNLILRHPDSEIDLCIIFLMPAIELLSKSGKELIFSAFQEQDVFTNTSQSQFHEWLGSIETVHMTGYPNTLWDDVNNKPITRRGITASNIREDWQGRPNFMIDMACFPGSSGSPVYIFDEGSFNTANGVVASSNGRLILLGVLHSGPTFQADGQIRIESVPTNASQIISTNIMMNLGIIVKGRKILEFKDIIYNLLPQE